MSFAEKRGAREGAIGEAIGGDDPSAKAGEVV